MQNTQTNKQTHKQVFKATPSQCTNEESKNKFRSFAYAYPGFYNGGAKINK